MRPSQLPIGDVVSEVVGGAARTDARDVCGDVGLHVCVPEATHPQSWLMPRIVVLPRRQFALRIGSAGNGCAQSRGGATAKKGLSQFMLQRNQHLKAARAAKGRRLSREEVLLEMLAFQRTWDVVKDDPLWRDAYNEWRWAPLAKRPHRYQCTWG